MQEQLLHVKELQLEEPYHIFDCDRMDFKTIDTALSRCINIDDVYLDLKNINKQILILLLNIFIQDVFFKSITK